MKEKEFTIFRRITILVFSLITILGILFIAITYLTITHYHQASTQLLNKDVAAHIARFTSPFENGAINKQKADSIFHDAMVLSPSIEVYFLDTAGNIIAFHALQNEIRLKNIPLTNINKYIAAEGEEYIKAPDPKAPDDPKIFSAAEVVEKGKKLGYIYVILGSKSSENIMSMLVSSHISSLAIKAFAVIIILSLLISLFYLMRIRKSFNRLIDVLQRFESGDYTARFPIKAQDDLAPVTNAFNKMADLLAYNINRITISEQERKDFIANISHDLRTPLSIARGYTETVLMKKEKSITPQQEEDFLQLIYRKIRQVEHMVKQLFDLSKMESVEFAPAKEPFVFSEILLELIQASASAATEKNIITDCTKCENLSWIFADVRMMERVIQNLLVNAINYTPEHGLITVSLINENGELVFQIENSSGPLSPELLQWINNSDDTNVTISRPASSGIGLVIVKKILQLHQYVFKAERTTGAGNKFSIYMPVLQNEAP